MGIKENIAYIDDLKAQAAEKRGCKPEDVLLVAVTKTRTADEINEAIAVGVTDIGENKVQEILDKYDHVKPVKWHMIGHLQTNKVKYIIDKVSVIHSVDSIKLAEEINKRAEQHGICMDILIQVNSAEEESKFGIKTDETESMIRFILENFKNLRICGLMCMAPYLEDTEEVRKYFKAVRRQYDEFKNIAHERLDFKHLSMGMSHDFQVAVEEGSNLIRVGTAIFGNRIYF